MLLFCVLMWLGIILQAIYREFDHSKFVFELVLLRLSLMYTHDTCNIKSTIYSWVHALPCDLKFSIFSAVFVFVRSVISTVIRPGAYSTIFQYLFLHRLLPIRAPNNAKLVNLTGSDHQQPPSRLGPSQSVTVIGWETLLHLRILERCYL